jgi:D-alanyl-D-alanine carboxypeptidase
VRPALILGVPVVLVVAGAVALTRQGEGEPRELEQALAAVVAAGVPGALVRVRDGDETVELTAGEATAGVRFRVGSVTKTFVAVLTLLLVDRGALSLDDPVARHVPGLLRDGERVTVRMLLNHTTGLFDYTGDPSLLRDDLSPRELIRIADGRQRSSGYAYSSTNYLVLGLVLESAGRAPLAALLRRLVFEPFELGDTSFEPGVVSGSHLHGHALAVRDGIATGSPRDTSAVPATSAWSAGAIVSTAADLDRFMARLADSGLAARMAPRPGRTYGLGLARAATPCGEAVGHTGNLLGTVTVVRSHGARTAIVAANAYPFTPDVERRFDDLLREALCA